MTPEIDLERPRAPLPVSQKRSPMAEQLRRFEESLKEFQERTCFAHPFSTIQSNVAGAMCLRGGRTPVIIQRRWPRSSDAPHRVSHLRTWRSSRCATGPMAMKPAWPMGSLRMTSVNEEGGNENRKRAHGTARVR
jgi:hypothetical protein